MVRLLVLLATALCLALPVAIAAATRSDGTLSVKRGRGEIHIRLRGTVIGSMASGSVRVRQLAPVKRPPQFRHCRVHVINAQTTVCTGKKLFFRAFDGRYVVVTKGAGIFLSAVGRGSASFDGAGDGTTPTGVMSFDDGPYQSIPVEPTTYDLGTTP